VMLMPAHYDTWLGATSAPEELRPLLKPYDANLMEAYAVSRVVNSVKNDTPECIYPA
jgi:putative SOS response-associated peptidase YedK